jgi:hypothetical protein
MRLVHRPLQLRDVKNCAALLASHPEERRRYGDTFAKVIPAWLRMLRTGCMQGMVLEDIDSAPPHLSACGISAFISDEFVQELKASPLRWISPELTLRALREDAGILDPKRVRAANTYDGLNLIVWLGIANPTRPEDFTELAMEIMRAFWENHVGYRLKEILCQPNEIEPIRFTLNSGMMVWDPTPGRYIDGRGLVEGDFFHSPFLIGETREAGLSQIGSRQSMFFVYTQPKIFFRPGEQRLLSAALRGLTDENLADELTISLSAVKKTWRLVYERASRALPNLNRSEKSDDGADSRRGKEKKQRLLSYLRDHREELRPVLPPKATRLNHIRDLQGGRSEGQATE